MQMKRINFMSSRQLEELRLRRIFMGLFWSDFIDQVKIDLIMLDSEFKFVDFEFPYSFFKSFYLSYEYPNLYPSGKSIKEDGFNKLRFFVQRGQFAFLRKEKKIYHKKKVVDLSDEAVFDREPDKYIFDKEPVKKKRRRRKAVVKPETLYVINPKWLHFETGAIDYFNKLTFPRELRDITLDTYLAGRPEGAALGSAMTILQLEHRFSFADSFEMIEFLRTKDDYTFFFRYWGKERSGKVEHIKLERPEKVRKSRRVKHDKRNRDLRRIKRKKTVDFTGEIKMKSQIKRMTSMKQLKKISKDI